MRIQMSISVALLVVGIGTALWGQGASGGILGTIRDQSGGVVPGANVVITNQGTGRARNIATDVRGSYRAPGLEAGTYDVQATLSGFRSVVKRGVELNVGSEVVVDIAMEVGEVTESISVEAEVPLVQTTSAQLSGLVGHEQIRDLPLNARSFEQLALLEPGLVQHTNFTPSVGVRTTNGGGTKMSIAGLPTNFNSYLLDGTAMRDHSGFGLGSVATVNLGIDSILEFQVLTQNYSAQYGLTAGGIINSVTRSGTNTLHGGAFEFLRNNVFDARQFFDVGGTQPFRRNQFGAFIGGPIVRNRTFFFGNYEGLRERLATTGISTVPDANARQGIVPGRTIAVSPVIRP